MSSYHNQAIEYRPEIDGLRAPVLTASGFNLKKILRALVLFASEIYGQFQRMLADFYTKVKNTNQHHRQINTLLAV